MDEVDATSQALMRLINITMTRETNEQRRKRIAEQEEFDNIRHDMGLDNNIEDYVSTYIGGW